MDKAALKSELTEKHNKFTDYINGLSNNDFLFHKNEKWSAGQQLNHIFLSVRPVNLALLVPKMLLKLSFGQAIKSRTYDELVSAYQNVLDNGGKAGVLFVPKNISFAQKQNLITNLTDVVKSLNEKIDKLSEEELDKYILPHPLIGKTTIREMLYFTIYHVQHHERTTKENLSKFKD